MQNSELTRPSPNMGFLKGKAAQKVSVLSCLSKCFLWSKNKVDAEKEKSLPRVLRQCTLLNTALAPQPAAHGFSTWLPFPSSSLEKE